MGVTEVTVMADWAMPIAPAAATTTACLIFVCSVEVAGSPETSVIVCVTKNMAVCGSEGCWVGVPGRGVGR